jgi:hypothetical protein
VVLAVVGDPAHDRALDGHRAGDAEQDLHAPVRLEGLVREVAVEADRDAEPGEGVHDDSDDHVAPTQPAAPGDRHGGDDREHRQHDENADRDLLGP